MFRATAALAVGLVLSASRAMAQTTDPIPPAGPAATDLNAEPPAIAETGGYIGDWWWLILLVLLIAAVAWYFMKKRKPV